MIPTNTPHRFPDARKWSNVLLPTALALITCACGGDGGIPGNGSTGGNSNNAPVGGIWRGTDITSGLGLVGLVAETGDFHFIRSDDVQYVGIAVTSGNNLTANVEGIVPLGVTFGDGGHHGNGTLTGTVQPRQTISGNIKFTTDRKSTL